MLNCVLYLMFLALGLWKLSSWAYICEEFLIFGGSCFSFAIILEQLCHAHKE